MQKTTLIVGAGIAGLSLAYQFEKRKLPYKVIDSGINHSSTVAAGIINPVVFRRMALSWRVADFLPVAKQFYHELEEKLNCKLLNHIPIRRAFAHEQERELWLTKEKEDSHSSFLSQLNETESPNKVLKQKFGTGIVKESYWIDTKVLIQEWQTLLIAEDKLIQSKFDYNALDIQNSSYQLNPDEAIAFDKVIFCEGYHGLENPFFNYLPLQATKGELLTIHSEELPENESFNYKCFVLPTGNQMFKLGATYAWNSPNIELTETAKNELIGHFDNLLEAKFELIKHEAGVRPTVLDRRPLLGKHPIHESLYIYNGLGAKGYLISPKLSEEFMAFLFDNQELDKEVDIKRYKDKYTS